MNWIWILPAGLAVTLAGVFFPLFSRRGDRPLPPGLEDHPSLLLEQERDQYLRQIREMELEGGGDPAQGQARRELEGELAEVLTRLDALAGGPAAVVAAPPPGNRTVDRAVALSVIIAIAAVAGGLYLAMGTPMIVPPRNAPQAEGFPDQVRQMVANLAERMQGEPDNIEGWYKLARSWEVLERPDLAIQAYRHILSRQPENIDASAGLAQMLIQGEDSGLVDEGVRLYETVLARDPERPDALWSLGMIARRDGDTDKALTLWRRLLPLLPPDNPARPMVEQAIREAETR